MPYSYLLGAADHPADDELGKVRWAARSRGVGTGGLDGFGGLGGCASAPEQRAYRELHRTALGTEWVPTEGEDQGLLLAVQLCDPL